MPLPNTNVLTQQPQPPHAGRITFRDICNLFCCPPFPSSIVSKLAFMPPTPSYKIISNPDNDEYVLIFIFFLLFYNYLFFF